jgi:hypothetical protein
MTPSELVGEIDSNRQQGNFVPGDTSLRAGLLPHPRDAGRGAGCKARGLIGSGAGMVSCNRRRTHSMAARRPLSLVFEIISA